MTDELLKKLREREKTGAPLGPCVRISDKKPLMLGFERNNGNRISLAYHLLIAIQLNSDGLWFDFGAYKLYVRGERLSGIYDAVREQEASFLFEGDERHETPDKTLPFIKAISWKWEEPI